MKYIVLLLALSLCISNVYSACNPACAPGLCCSRWGYCGTGPDYCGSGTSGGGSPGGSFSNAKITWYNGNGNLGSCGTPINDGEYVVAMNTQQMANGPNPNANPNCGRRVTISYGGKTITATVRDTCPGCPYGGLDLTPSAFSALAPLGTGVIYGSWSW